MARARPPKSRRARPAAPRAAGRARGARPAPAERRLLELARELGALGRDARAGADALRAALERLAGAYAPGAPLAADLHRAWLDSRGDKTAALALAWAREQVRLALEELVALAPQEARRRVDAPPDAVAWLLLAACEAIGCEPPAAAADRTRTLLELTGR
ncbi:MAG TPA: hypothetical protein DDZ42_03870 [Candidatus Rokubacteria bacterium]|nr:MAG: hypothetical protein A2050_02435 [Candidatus Rokubacteria bacterium GWA2_73_35]HBH01054.1 hypothetical protein [Candidatus Rokubacteria bacterium]